MIFSTRRIPGILSLAATNICASFIWLAPIQHSTNGLTEAGRTVMPLEAWAFAWLVSAIGLICSILLRSLTTLNIFGGLSLAVWTGFASATVWTFLLGGQGMGLVPWALLLWMIAGQASMILSPLWKPPVHDLIEAMGTNDHFPSDPIPGSDDSDG